VYQSSQVYQDCTISVPIVKNRQNSKNDHCCTNRHMFTKAVPTVYQSSKAVKNSQKAVKTAKITIGVPIVTSTQSPPNTQSHSNYIDSEIKQENRDFFIRRLHSTPP